MNMSEKECQRRLNDVNYMFIGAKSVLNHFIRWLSESCNINFSNPKYFLKLLADVQKRTTLEFVKCEAGEYGMVIVGSVKQIVLKLKKSQFGYYVILEVGPDSGFNLLDFYHKHGSVIEDLRFKSFNHEETKIVFTLM